MLCSVIHPAVFVRHGRRLEEFTLLHRFEIQECDKRIANSNSFSHCIFAIWAFAHTHKHRIYLWISFTRMYTIYIHNGATDEKWLPIIFHSKSTSFSCQATEEGVYTHFRRIQLLYRLRTIFSNQSRHPAVASTFTPALRPHTCIHILSATTSSEKEPKNRHKETNYIDACIVVQRHQFGAAGIILWQAGGRGVVFDPAKGFRMYFIGFRVGLGGFHSICFEFWFYITGSYNYWL